MADTYVKVGSTWRPLKKIYVKVGSTWREIQKTYVKVGSTWRLVYQNATWHLTNNTHIAYAIGGFEFRSNGRVYTASYIFPEPGGPYLTYQQINSGTDWIIPNAAASEDNYYIRFTHISGTAPTEVDALNTWLSLSSNRLVSWSSGVSSISGTVRVEIRNGAGTIVASANYTGGCTAI